MACAGRFGWISSWTWINWNSSLINNGDHRDRDRDRDPVP
jgi:hypothetical protein